MISHVLGELEQAVLLAVMQTGEGAYGVAVQREIQLRTRRDLTVATIHKTLTRLEDKGLVRSELGEPTPERGGRRKRIYRVTAAGRRALQRSVAALRALALGLDLGTEMP